MKFGNKEDCVKLKIGWQHFVSSGNGITHPSFLAVQPKTQASDVSCVLTIVPHSSSTDSLDLQEVLHQSLELCLFLYIITGSRFLAHSVPGSRSRLNYIHNFLLFWL